MQEWAEYSRLWINRYCVVVFCAFVGINVADKISVLKGILQVLNLLNN